MTSNLSEETLRALANLLRARIGLDFPDSRLDDLRKRITPALAELNLDEARLKQNLTFAHFDQTQIETMAKYLTIGETYFFRDPKLFQSLETSILPDLIKRTIAQRRPLRIWTAACSSGEEPYSLAILLHRLVPATQRKLIQILATDINPSALLKARQGRYTSWSFRTTPNTLRQTYFREVGDGHFEIIPELKELVSFKYNNLVDPLPFDLPGGSFHTVQQDMIFCRNVLIYFPTDQIQKVSERLHRCLAPDGLLFVAACEISHMSQTLFESQLGTGVSVLRKRGADAPKTSTPERRLLKTTSSSLNKLMAVSDAEQNLLDGRKLGRRTSTSLHRISLKVNPVLLQATDLAANGKRSEASKLLLKLLEDRKERDPNSIRLLVNCLAGAGEIRAAIDWLDRAIEDDSINQTIYYMKALLLEEIGDLEGALMVLRQCLFLEPKYVMAKFMLSGILAKLDRQEEASVQLNSLLGLLTTMRPETILPDSDGLTVSQVKEFVSLKL